MPMPQRKRKKKYNARFPPARIKKMMQTDEEVGKVAAAVPVIISRALELFSSHLLNGVSQRVSQTGAKTISPAHLKQCIMSEPRFDFLRDLVADVPDLPASGQIEPDDNVDTNDQNENVAKSGNGGNSRRLKRAATVGRRRVSRKKATFVAETFSNSSSDSSDAAIDTKKEKESYGSNGVPNTSVTSSLPSTMTPLFPTLTTATFVPTSTTSIATATSVGLTLLSPSGSASATSSAVMMPSTFSQLDEDYDEE